MPLSTTPGLDTSRPKRESVTHALHVLSPKSRAAQITLGLPAVIANGRDQDAPVTELQIGTEEPLGRSASYPSSGPPKLGSDRPIIV
jgi:hypothetical protein